MSTTFRIWAPIRAFEKASAPEGMRRRIAGVISTEKLDKQGEIVVQKGLNFGPFLREGYFNDNHKRDTTSPLGFPEDVKKFAKGERLPDGTQADSNLTWAEGVLFDTPDADKVWTLANAMQKAGPQRRLGFSIEGSVTRRQGPLSKTVAGADVRHVAITNCFPGDTVVSGAAEMVMRRPYSGQMVTVVLSTGEKITGTPNHPVLTQRGWVALGALDERHDRVGRLDRDLVTASPVSHHVEHVPTSLEQVFDLAQLSGPADRRAVHEGEFHGDGVSGEVDVVAVHGLLRDRLDASFREKFGEDALPASDKELTSFADNRLLLDLGVGGFAAAPSSVSGVSQLLALGGSAGPIATNLLIVSSADDAPTLGDVIHRAAVQAESLGEEPRTLSGRVGFSNIARKTLVDGFTGHVFNLETTHGWYDANGIVAHNCPVGEGTRLEPLAKAMCALEDGADDDEVNKALSAGDSSEPASEQGPITGEGAGAVLQPQHLEEEGEAKMDLKRPDEPKKDPGLKKSQAVAIIAHRLGVDEAAATHAYETLADLRAAGLF